MDEAAGALLAAADDCMLTVQKMSIAEKNMAAREIVMNQEYQRQLEMMKQKVSVKLSMNTRIDTWAFTV